jgi:hypothetical protein
MYCPKCKYEYKDEIKKCPDCGAELVEALPGPEPVKEFDTTVLTRVNSEMDGLILIDLLEEAGIECFLRDFTNVMKVSLGKDGAWGDIVVNKEKLAEAKKILEDFNKEI